MGLLSNMKITGKELKKNLALLIDGDVCFVGKRNYTSIYKVVQEPDGSMYMQNVADNKLYSMDAAVSESDTVCVNCTM